MFIRSCVWWPVVFLCAAGSLSLDGAEYRPPRKELPFPVYTNVPPGRQLSGQHAPATTPALSPEAAQARFVLPRGFEIRLFASEPEVVNPVAMTWDEHGRLWVLELYEYPLGAKDGQKPRDRIKILEDTDADGRADKVTVWADGLNLATGLVLGRDGAYVGAAPNLLFLQDTDGDDRADVSTVQLTGFGLEDRHELLNGFAWGPDGLLYMTHGVFTRSSVRLADSADAEPVLLTAGVARFDPLRKSFEVFAEGTSNPWGVDFDRFGNAFVSACVIEHLFHMVPGGIYDRQAGTEPNPYVYQRLPAINDHRHHMAAYAGVQVYQGDQFPEENLGSILEGNIHDNAIHQDLLRPNGSSFTASAWRDLVRANDGWFMPVSTQVGPDGAVWIMDWYDRYPCYQNANADPEGVDREHGRIWRVVYTGAEHGKPVPSRPNRDMDLKSLTSAGLTQLLTHRNVWHRRTAQRLLSERRDDTVMGRLQSLLLSSPEAPSGSIETRLAALWTLHGSGYLSDDTLAKAARDPAAIIRAWAARLIGQRQLANASDLGLLSSLAADSDVTVRLAVAVACRQLTSGQLTVNTPPLHRDVAVMPILTAVMKATTSDSDPVLPFMLWQAIEPWAASHPEPALEWLAREGPHGLPMSAQIAGKLMRRLCDTGEARWMDAAVRFLERLDSAKAPLITATLRGLIKGQEGKALVPSVPLDPLLERLRQHPNREVMESGQELGALWGNRASVDLVFKLAAGPAPVEERIRAIRVVRRTKSTEAQSLLKGLLAPTVPEPVQVEAIAALGEFTDESIAGDLLAQWKELSPAARRAAGTTLTSRRQWIAPLLEQIRAGGISATELGAPTLRSLTQHRDNEIRREARTAIGRFRESSADRARLVAEKRRVVLGGNPDLEAGREAARRACFVCHKLNGEGAEVGPDLTGVGRSSLDALLWNVVDPNQVIGAGYEQVEVETKDDRVIAGRLMENTDQRVRLLLQGPKEEVIPRSEVRSQRTLEASVMPEGLEQMPDEEFRNMIWYILAPPEEGALTEAKRRILLGGGE